MIHDRLPLLDLPQSVFPRSRGDAAFVHCARRRQQVGCIVVARVVERLDARCERLTLLVFGYKSQLALRVLWYVTPRYKGQVRLYKRASFPLMSIGL